VDRPAHEQETVWHECGGQAGLKEVSKKFITLIAAGGQKVKPVNPICDVCDELKWIHKVGSAWLEGNRDSPHTRTLATSTLTLSCESAYRRVTASTLRTSLASATIRRL
jgi:hypothetical protein